MQQAHLRPAPNAQARYERAFIQPTYIKFYRCHISSPRNENETSHLDVEHCRDRFLLLTHKCDVIILMYGGMAGHPLLDY